MANTPNKPSARALALVLAVVHHGLANFSSEAVPAGFAKVLDTAKKFEEHLVKGTD